MVERVGGGRRGRQRVAGRKVLLPVGIMNRGHTARPRYDDRRRGAGRGGGGGSVWLKLHISMVMVVMVVMVGVVQTFRGMLLRVRSSSRTEQLRRKQPTTGPGSLGIPRWGEQTTTGGSSSRGRLGRLRAKRFAQRVVKVQRL